MTRVVEEPTYPARLLAVWQVVQHWPLDVGKLFTLVFEVLWRTAVLVGLSLFAYSLVQTGWGVLKFLGQALLQKFRKVATADEQKNIAA